MKFVINIHEVDPASKENTEGHPYLYAIIEKHEDGKMPTHCALKSESLTPKAQTGMTEEQYRDARTRNFFHSLTDLIGREMFPSAFKPLPNPLRGNPA